jgi:pimeloyl-ACP methyl ester carboxylesterase
MKLVVATLTAASFLLATPAAADLAKPGYPVIFIHGLASNADASWGAFRDYLVAGGWTFGGRPELLENGIVGFTNLPADFYTMSMSDWQGPAPSRSLTFEQQGLQVAAVIRRVLAVNPEAEKVILVGHSMGGLAARAYVQSLGQNHYAGDVAKIITIGTPHLGSDLLKVCVDSPSDSWVCEELNVLISTSAALTSLRPGSAELTALNQDAAAQLPSDIEYVVLAGYVDFPLLSIQGPHGDGIVTVDSQLFLATVSGIRRTLASYLLFKRSDCGRLVRPVLNVGLVGELHTCETRDASVQAGILKHLVTPSIAWVTQPPSAMIAGNSYSVSWKITRGTRIASTDARWDQIDPTRQDRCSSSTTPPCMTQNVAGAGSPGTFSASIVAPLVGSPAAYAVVVQAAVDGLTIWSPTVTSQVLPGSSAAISVSPGSASFGDVAVGSSRDLSFTISNSSGASLSGSVSVSGDFAVVSGSPYSIAAGNQSQVVIRFRPTTLGRTAINATFSGGGGTTRLLIGNGIAPGTLAQRLSVADRVWFDVQPATSPSLRSGSAMAFDGTRSQVLLFGGCTSSCGGPGSFLGDTWIWNGTTWVQQQPPHSPSPRYGHVMTYDSARGELVLFGGISAGSVVHDDTWVWNGSDWTQQNPATRPAAQYFAALAFDAPRAQAVLIGGVDQFGEAVTGTWVWTGSDWIQKSPSNAPSARYEPTMAYDSIRGHVVLFGGNGPRTGGYKADTWIWDGSNWNELNPAHSPPARAGHVMAADPIRGEIVLVGGDIGVNNFADDTWTWDGLDWTQRNIGAGPTPRLFAAMAFDQSSGQMVLFGGQTCAQCSSTWVRSSPFDFETVAIGNHRDLPLTISNTGNAPVAVTASVAAPFSVINGSSFTLAAGDSRQVALRFAPVAVGAISRNVSFGAAAGGVSATLYGVGGGVPSNLPLPVVATGVASTVRASEAALQGTIALSEINATAWFEWGTTTAYDQVTPARAIGTGTGLEVVAAALTGLTTGVAYHYRLVAQNTSGIRHGADQSFVTVDRRATLCAGPNALAVPTSQEGSFSESFTVLVTNCGAGTLSYSVSVNQPWLSVSPGNGTSTGETDVITVIASSSTSFAGAGYGTVTVTDLGTPGHQRQIPIVLTPPFTDQSLRARSSVIRAVHVSELRNRVNALRERFGLAAQLWTDSMLAPSMSIIQPQHMIELRSALAGAYSAAGAVAPNYSNVIEAGAVVRLTDVTELRSAVVALEGLSLEAVVPQALYAQPSDNSGTIPLPVNLQFGVIIGSFTTASVARRIDSTDVQLTLRETSGFSGCHNNNSLYVDILRTTDTTNGHDAAGAAVLPAPYGNAEFKTYTTRLIPEQNLVFFEPNRTYYVFVHSQCSGGRAEVMSDTSGLRFFGFIR